MAGERKDVVLFEKVLTDLQDFLPYLVLVGGWVPYLYARYLWKISHEPISTTDIDFGFQDIAYKKGKTVASRIMEKQYGEHHVDMGRLYPFVPIAKLGGGKINADVEFIRDSKTSDFIREKLIGMEIKINTIDDFDILLESPVTITVKKLQVRVPNPAVFTFHKLLTFARREKTEKRLKDLYYAYFVLRLSPEKEKLSRDISQHIRKSKQGKRVQANIGKHFKNPYDKGPSWIREVSEGSAIERLVEDIQNDAFERIKKLIPKHN